MIDGLLLNVMSALVVMRAWTGEANLYSQKLITSRLSDMLANIYVPVAFPLC